MQLRLRYPPTPEYAAQHADLCVQSARDVSGIVLDYAVLLSCLRLANGGQIRGHRSTREEMVAILEKVIAS